MFVAALVLVIAGAGSNLLGFWSTASQQAAREARQRQVSLRPNEDQSAPRPAPFDTRPAPRDPDPDFFTSPPPRVADSFDVKDVLARLASADLEKGAAMFKVCTPCHSDTRDGSTKIGPNLWGIIGSRKAAVPGYNYSAALQEKGGTWTYEDLAQYNYNPRQFAPGTRMTFFGIRDNQRMANLIAYLRTRADRPAPLPK
jgi:cytochrome c